VVVNGDSAYIVYFTHPGLEPGTEDSWVGRRSTIHAAELGVVDRSLVCDRSSTTPVQLVPPVD
jgi:hypothetical protein